MIESFTLKTGETFIVEDNKIIIVYKDSAIARKTFEEYLKTFRKLGQLN